VLVERELDGGDDLSGTEIATHRVDSDASGG